MTNPDMPGLEEATSAMLDRWMAMMPGVTNLGAMQLLAGAAYPIIERALREKIWSAVNDWLNDPPPADTGAANGCVSVGAAWPILDIIRGGSDE